MDDFDPYLYRRMRDNMPANDPWQALAGPLEHRDSARELVASNPWMAAPLAAGIPLWTLLKQLGMLQTRSPASMDEVFGGYEGLFSGLKDRYGSQPPVVQTPPAINYDPLPERANTVFRDAETGVATRIPNVYRDGLTPDNSVMKDYGRTEQQRRKARGKQSI